MARSARRRRSRRCSGNTASFSGGATKPSRSDAAANRSDGSSTGAADVHPLAQPGRFQAPEVVGGPLALAAAGKRHHRPVARAHELLELRLGLAQRARRRVRRLGPQLDLLAAGQRRQPDPRPLLRARPGCSPGSRTGGGRPRLRTRRTRRSSGRSAPARAPPRRPPRSSVSAPIRSSSAPKRSTRQQLGDVRPLGVLAVAGARRSRWPRRSPPSSRCSAASSAAGAISTSSHIPERALRERREPAQRFDLHVEHVHPHGALLGRREHVQQASPQRELPALLHLVDALVARAHELGRALVEVQQLAHAQRERVRAQRRVGHLLRQRHRADHHDRLPSVRRPGRCPQLARALEQASSAATRRPTRCGGGARWDS